MAQMSLCCPKHPNEQLIEDDSAGDVICPKCGLVVGERLIDVSAEWRTFGSDDGSGVDRSRVGPAESDFFDQLITPTGYSFSSDTNSKPVRINTSHLSASNKHLRNAFSALVDTCDRLHLPNVILLSAKRIFKVVYESEKVKLRNLEAILGACLYIACRQNQAHRTFKEICAECQASERDIGRVFLVIQKNVSFKLSVVSPKDYIHGFSATLNLPYDVIKSAVRISNAVATLGLCRGRSPISVAAVVVMLASEFGKARKNVAEVAQVTRVAPSTIQAIYKELHPLLYRILVSNQLIC